jgi:Na+/H+ antiporter NhaC
MSWILVLALATCPVPETLETIEISSNRPHQIGSLPLDLTLRAVDAEGETVAGYCGTAALSGVHNSDGDAVPTSPAFVDGKATLSGVTVEGDVRARVGDREATFTLPTIPGVATILPPLLAVIVAILLRQAVIALFAGIWLGALFLHGYNPLTALLRTFDDYVLTTVADKDHAAIMLFTVALGGMVGLLSRSGATHSLVEAIARKAKTRRSGLLTSWAAGLAIFFDDYANCLLVGNTVRPFTDKLRISREKLAYIVDSTAAPIATVAVVSTWIGFQIGELDKVFDGQGYDLFLSALPYSFYSFLTIAFVFMLSWSTRDFGPMLRAERRAVETGHLFEPGSNPLMDADLTDNQPELKAHWLVAVVPVASVVLIVLAGLYITGSAASESGASLREVLGNADPYSVLIWASFGGSFIALAAVMASRRLDLTQGLDAWTAGAKAMTMALMILILAWTIGSICKEHLHTGQWLLSQLSPNPRFMPILTFVIAGAIALATGSSYSTMAIMIPIAGPMAVTSAIESGLPVAEADVILHATLAAILGGAVFGDHCSPISDTTIMSSMASASDHVDHVKTQAPYAFLCAGAACGAGYLWVGVIPWWASLAIGLVLLAGVLWFFGKKAEGAPTTPDSSALPS